LIAALREVRNENDQFIFYFAGHGLAGGVNDFYLLRDFGSDPNGPLDAMINYSDFKSAMQSQLASQQLLVFDGCRDIDDLVSANTWGGTGLVTADPNVRRFTSLTMLQCCLQSSEKDGVSYGKPWQPSVCAQAFERALSGAAGKRTSTGWNITSGRICEAMSDLQTLGFGPNAGIVQRPDPSSYRDFPVMRLARPPLVPVFMRRKDGGSLQGATVTCEANGNVVHREASVVERYWEGQLGIGPHYFDVVLADGSRCPGLSDTVSPTHLPIEVEIP